MRRVPLAFAAALLPILALAAPAPTPTPKATLPSEMPASFKPAAESHDFERRIAEIPMRDGVKLHTVILVPRGAKNAAILLTRTPYDADEQTSRTPSTHLAMNLDGYDNAVDTIVEGGYIRAVQDVR